MSPPFSPLNSLDGDDFLEPRFIPFTSDYGFKATFGNESDTRFLLRALQALIQSPVPIVRVEFSKTEFIGLNIASRSGFYDLACVDAEGNFFIVEMQVADFPQFFQRMKFYGFQRFNTMVKKGKYLFNNLTRIYCIGILANNIYLGDSNYYHFGQVRSENGLVMDSLQTYITVELQKFDVPKSAITTDLEKLIFTLKNFEKIAMQPTTEHPAFWTEEWLDAAIQELDARKLTPEQYEQYANELARQGSATSIVMRDIAIAEERGEQKGIEKGKIEGKMEGKIESVLGMHKIGIDEKIIAQALSMPLSEVQRIIITNT